MMNMVVKKTSGDTLLSHNEYSPDRSGLLMEVQYGFAPDEPGNDDSTTVQTITTRRSFSVVTTQSKAICAIDRHLISGYIAEGYSS